MTDPREPDLIFEYRDNARARFLRWLPANVRQAAEEAMVLEVEFQDHVARVMATTSTREALHLAAWIEKNVARMASTSAWLRNEFKLWSERDPGSMVVRVAPK